MVTDLAGDGAAVSSEQSQSLIGASPSPEPAAVAGNPAVCAESAKAFRWRLRDGGGVGSDADWGSPREETDVLSALRVEWLRLIHDWHLVPRLLKAVAERSKDAWLSEEEVHILREVLVSFLKSRGLKCSAAIEPGQPLALELWEGLFSLCGDVDQQLPSLLREGVPTGILRTIPPSGVWRETEVPERPNLELHTFDTPWGSAREDCHTACELVEEDVKAGFAVWLDGGLAEAKKQFGDNCAAGRLGVVKKAGSAPRLIGDSSISNANHLCRISEKVEMPSLEDVSQFLSRRQGERWIAFLMDISKAHKRVKVAPKERGFSLFAVLEPGGRRRWVVYNTCHFGCSWAAYWWSRVAAGFIRLGHRVLWHGHFLVIYVDDSLSLFPASSAPIMACLQVVLACALGLPLSWHKMDLGSSVKWIGWCLRLDGVPVATLPDEKAARLCSVLRQLASSTKCCSRKEIESFLGLLIWFTGGARWLKPWLSVFFHMLRKPTLRFLQLDRRQLAELEDLLQTDLAVKADAVLSDVRKGWKLLECSGHEARLAVWQDLLRWKNGLAWLKFGDWTCDSVKPCAEEKQVAGFFLQLIEARVPVQLVELEQKAVVAAADAFADAREAGLGGWWLPAGSPLEVGQIRWFSFKVQLADLPSWFRPQRQSGQPGSLQAIICALEALAQLILLALQRQDGLVTNAGRVVVRQQCDNLGVVGAAAKGFSMKEPVAAVLQAAAVYCMRERINLRVSHVAGSRNEWADMLSRGAAAYPDFWHRLSAHSRRSLDWQQLLSAGRPECLCRASKTGP